MIELVIPLAIEGTKVGMFNSKPRIFATARCAASWVNCSAKKVTNKGIDMSDSHDRSVGAPAPASSIASLARSRSFEFAKKGAMDPYHDVAMAREEMAVRKIKAGSRPTSGPEMNKTSGQLSGSDTAFGSGSGSLSKKKEIFSRSRGSLAILLSSFSMSLSPEPHSFLPRMIYAMDKYE